VCDDVLRELFKVDAAMQLTQSRSQPQVAARIAQHLDGLRDVIGQIS